MIFYPTEILYIKKKGEREKEIWQQLNGTC